MSRARTTPNGERDPEARRLLGIRGLPGFGAPAGDIETAVRRVFAPQLDPEEDGGIWSSWRGTLRLLRPLGAVSQGNRIEVFADGDRAFEAMWSALEGARASVSMTTYTLEPDRTGRRTLELLTEAARRGCRVTLVYDAFGSFRLGSALLRPLREAGARVVSYNPVLRGPVFRGMRRVSRLVRNHRKILVVDDRLGFCGGMNVAEEYAGPRHGTGLFRDTHLAIEGPCAGDLARLVERVAFGEARRGRGPRPGRRRIAVSEPPEEGSLVQVLESNVPRQRRAIQTAMRHTIARAAERCYLTTPYFVPPARLIHALERAARRGVEVRVLTAGRSDVPLVHLASQHLYGRLLRTGVSIFEMQARTLHAKTATIDGVYASVGSFNLDRWSDRRNLEVNVTALDPNLAQHLEEDFRADLEVSEEVTLERWERRSRLQRLVHALAYLLLR